MSAATSTSSSSSSFSVRKRVEAIEAMLHDENKPLTEAVDALYHLSRKMEDDNEYTDPYLPALVRRLSGHPRAESLFFWISEASFDRRGPPVRRMFLLCTLHGALDTGDNVAALETLRTLYEDFATSDTDRVVHEMLYDLDGSYDRDTLWPQLSRAVVLRLEIWFLTDDICYTYNGFKRRGPHRAGSPNGISNEDKRKMLFRFQNIATRLKEAREDKNEDVAMTCYEPLAKLMLVSGGAMIRVIAGDEDARAEYNKDSYLMRGITNPLRSNLCDYPGLDYGVFSTLGVALESPHGDARDSRVLEYVRSWTDKHSVRDVVSMLKAGCKNPGFETKRALCSAFGSVHAPNRTRDFDFMELEQLWRALAEHKSEAEAKAEEVEKSEKHKKRERDPELVEKPEKLLPKKSRV